MCLSTLLQGSSLCVSALKLYLTRASPSKVTDCVAGWAEGRGETCWAWGWAKGVGCCCCCGCVCGCITLTWTRGVCFWVGGGGGGSSSSSSSAGRIWTKRKYSYSMTDIKALRRGVLGKSSKHGPHFLGIKRVGREGPPGSVLHFATALSQKVTHMN